MSPNVGPRTNQPQIPRWISVFAAFASLLLAVGAAVSLFAPQRLVAPGAQIDLAARIYAGYTFSRDFGLFIMICVGLVKGSRYILIVMMSLVSLINFCDAIMDVAESRIAVSGIAFLLSSIAAIASTQLVKTKPRM